MQPQEARIGYGMLAFAIFGSYLETRDDYAQALMEYTLRHPKSSSLHSLRRSDKFCTWYKRRLLAQYTLPESFTQAIDEALETLSPRYKEVIQAKFGLIDGKEKTLKEIGRKTKNMATGSGGVTRERARQMQDKALRFLRHPARRRKIKASLTDSYLRQLFGFEPLEE